MSQASPGQIGPGLRACNIGGEQLDANAEKAVVRALEDEWRAQATYETASQPMAAARLGNFARMEQRHAQALAYVLEQHGNAVPTRPAYTPAVPKDAPTMCKAGVEAEKQNIALYDELLRASLPEDVKCVFRHLQLVSKQRHLPAFEQCAG